MDFAIPETQGSKMAEEPLSISTTPLHKPTTIASYPCRSNEHQHQVISCPRLSWKYVKKYPKVNLINLKGLETVLSNGFKDHQTLKVSIKLTALIKVITLSRSLLFVQKLVLLVIYQMHMQVQQQMDL